MILPDINLLMYAYNQDAPLHVEARAWWETTMNGPRPVGIAWAVGLGFVRLMTHPRVLASPMQAEVAVRHVRTWVERPGVQVVDPGPRHLDLLARMLASAGVAGALTTDAHLAALAVEYDAEIHTNDADFARFDGVRHTNPLRG
jgi:uncharacterized protein